MSSRIAVPLYRSGTKHHASLATLRTALSKDSLLANAFDYPIYQKEGSNYLSTLKTFSSQLLADNPSTSLGPAEQKAQSLFFQSVNKVFSPFGVATFAVPFKCDYLWKTNISVPKEMHIRLPYDQFRLCLDEDTEINKAAEVYRSIQGPPLWTRVESGVDLSPENCYDWTKARGIMFEAKEYIKTLREKQDEFRKCGMEEKVAEIDNHIMDIVMTAVSFSEKDTRTESFHERLHESPVFVNRYAATAAGPTTYCHPLFQAIMRKEFERLRNIQKESTDEDFRADIDNTIMEYLTRFEDELRPRDNKLICLTFGV